MRLFRDAEGWWRLHSVHIFAVMAIFPAVWLASPDLQALLPAKIISAIAPVVAALGFVVRLREQRIRTMPTPTVPAAKA